jgi:hypothetical protein
LRGAFLFLGRLWLASLNEWLGSKGWLLCDQNVTVEEVVSSDHLSPTFPWPCAA